MTTVRMVDEGMELPRNERAALSTVPPAAWLPLLKCERRGVVWREPIGTAPTPVKAWVDAGRWIVQCPHCPNAQWVTWRDPRFLCVECENTAVGGRWVPVTFPDDKTREECERVLAARSPNDQFWFPDREDVVSLMGENVSRLNVPVYEGY